MDILRQKNKLSPGDRVEFVDPDTGELHSAVWGTELYDMLVPHAKLEKLTAWRANGWQPCRLLIDGFAIGQVVARLDTTADVAALKRDGHVVLVTRKASDEEARHFRWHRVPLRILDGKYQDWLFPDSPYAA